MPGSIFSIIKQAGYFAVPIHLLIWFTISSSDRDNPHTAIDMELDLEIQLHGNTTMLLKGD